MAVDLTSERRRPRCSAPCGTRHGRLDLLVNNAGAGWRATLRRRRLRKREPDDGAQLRRPGAPHRGAPAPAPRVRAELDRERVERLGPARPRRGRARTAASKFALAGWSESLYLEERRNGVHVGLVLPGFIATEGFPAGSSRRAGSPAGRSRRPERVAEAIMDAGPGGRPSATCRGRTSWPCCAACSTPARTGA